MKTTLSIASAGMAIILAFPMTASANDFSNCDSVGRKVAHRDRQEQQVQETTPISTSRPAFENQQRIMQEGQLAEDRYETRDNRDSNRYNEYQGDRQEGRRRRWHQRRYRQYQYRGDWR
jgi:hypothetical protein